ncbi:hypothetical protein HW132_30865 [Brasilonema sp. CT11]|nr:hypothetical protein [Brasilonema sp. CT11]
MNIQDQIKLRQQLCLMSDAYLTLSDNPVWLEMVALHPELEKLRQEAATVTDSVWHTFRSKCAS